MNESSARPDLFPFSRVLCDRTPLPARFLILGSAWPELLAESAESLAGRVEIIRMAGFSLAGIGFAPFQKRPPARRGVQTCECTAFDPFHALCSR